MKDEQCKDDDSWSEATKALLFDFSRPNQTMK